MKIRLKLFAGLRAAHRLGGQAGGGELEFQEGATVAQVLRKVRAPLEEAKVILVNGRHADPETVLEEGDTLSVFPPVGGG